MGETSPGNCTHEEGEDWIVWGVEGGVKMSGGVWGVERSTWEAVWRARRILRNI